MRNGTDRDIALEMVGTFNAILSAISDIALNVVDPVITVQPTDQVAAKNTPVTFTVVADNAASYQWQIDRDDGNGFQDQAESQIWNGTTTPSLTFLTADARLPFTFRCVVTNNHGSVISDEVNFTYPA